MVIVILMLVFIVILVLVWVTNKQKGEISSLVKTVGTQQNKIDALNGEIRSRSIMYGQFLEKFYPFIDELHRDSSIESISFLGNPIDYIIVRKNGIEFLEVKSGTSRLNGIQKRISQLIKDGKVTMRVVRIDKISGRENEGKTSKNAG